MSTSLGDGAAYTNCGCRPRRALSRPATEALPRKVFLQPSAENGPNLAGLPIACANWDSLHPPEEEYTRSLGGLTYSQDTALNSSFQQLCGI